MGFSVNTLDKQKQREEADMSVILKQRTARTADWQACLDTDTSAAFIVGPKGAKISNETANKLGLIDGRIPTKEEGGASDKLKQNAEDKSGRRKPAKGRPIVPEGPKTSPEQDAKAKAEGSGAAPEVKTITAPPPDDRATAIQITMLDMQREAEEGGEKVKAKLFTADGRPDSRVISARLKEQISAEDRDENWAKLAPSEPAAE